MNAQAFEIQINGTKNFYLRRAVERMREGLFDPLGVQWLTSGEEKLNRLFELGAADLKEGKSHHLCVCGAYGQGKSHSLTYLKQRALDANFVVSYINLDPRQIPFHDFKEVYRALMGSMVFPGGETSVVNVWQKAADLWLARPGNRERAVDDFILGEMPHRFRAILAAMAMKNMELPPGKRKLKKHARFQPRSFSWILKNALMGREIPAHRLSAAFHYREVAFYKDASLVCNEPGKYLTMVKGLARLFKDIGYGGWMLLFDEGESIAQTRITSRSKSYDLLHEIFCPDTPAPGFYPVFAFTHDFFTQLSEEPWDRTRMPVGRRKQGRPPEEIPCFAKNYHRAWKTVNIHLLQNLSLDEWERLTFKLRLLHGKAYGWAPDTAALQQKMKKVLSNQGGAESRMKLRLLVNQLDLEHQRETC